MSKKSKIRRSRKPARRSYAETVITAKKKSIPIVLALANKILEDIGFVDFINDKVKWDEKQCKVTPGHLTKAVILSTFFDTRASLSLIQERFIDMDTEFFFGEGVRKEDLNDYAIARALDKITDADPDRLFGLICQHAYVVYRIAFRRIHSDTTSMSFYGDYDDNPEKINEEFENELQIVQGYNKDHRPGCNQIVLGKIVNEHGIPLHAQHMNGNTSDKEWNEKALKFVGETYAEQLKDIIYVADSKLMDKNLFATLTDPDHPIRFVSRCPANFSKKLEERTIDEACTDGVAWSELGVFGSGKKACSYKAKEYEKLVNGSKVRLIVLHTDAGEKRFLRKKKKLRDELERDIEKQNKKLFACEADVLEEWQRFCKKHKKMPYQCDMEAVEIKREKRPRGNPGKNPKPPKIVSDWYLKIEIKGEDAKAMEQFQRKEEHFVLITSVDSDECDTREIVGTYKNQSVIEIDFRLFKEPCIASVIYLKTPERVHSLAILLHVALLVRALIQYKMRKAISECPEDSCPRVGRRGRKLQKNITTRFLIEELRNQSFIENERGEYMLNVTDEFRLLQLTTFLKLLGMTAGELIEY